MNSKILGIFLLTVIATLAVVSAQSFTTSTPETLTKNVTSADLTITNPTTSSITLSINVPAISDGQSHSLTISAPLSVTIPNQSSKTISFSYSGSTTNLAYGTFQTQVNLTSAADPADQMTIPLKFTNSFCENGDVSETSSGRVLKINYIKDTTSDTAWKWRPLDTVDIETEVRFDSNDNDDTIDAVIMLGIYDTVNNEILDFQNSNDQEKSISLDEGNTDTETLTVQVPVDLEKSSSRYKLFFKVYEDGSEDTVCRDYLGVDEFSLQKELNINKDSHQVSLSDITSEESLLCGETGTITATMSNIGTNSEKKVYANLYSKELGIDLNSDPVSLSVGSSKKVSFDFTVPQDLTEKTYTLKMYTKYRYDSSTEDYRETSDPYNTPSISISNCKPVETQSATVTASAPPTVTAGQVITIQANVKNTGTADTSFIVSPSGIDSFAVIGSIEPSQSFALGAGESKILTITLNTNSAAAGDYTYNIQASFAGKTQDQVLTVHINPKTSIFNGSIFSSITNNWLIGVIILVNIVLIVLIIVVAVRIMRK